MEQGKKIKCAEYVWIDTCVEPLQGSVAERSKALVLGTSLSRRGFESHRCQKVLLLYQIFLFWFLVWFPFLHKLII